jgi:atypical dual specificity phosphatase
MFASQAAAASPRVPGLYIGNVQTARDPVQLKRLGITHIVDLSQIDYDVPLPFVIRMRLSVPDVPEFDMRRIFGLTNAFIRRALLGGGRVLVHCHWGVSRSAAIVLAYLMSFGQLTYAEAASDLRLARPVVRPNEGFHSQLTGYEAQMQAFRARGGGRLGPGLAE